MADEQEQGGEEQAAEEEKPKAKKGKIGLIILIVVIILLLAGIGVGAFLMMSGGAKEKDASEDGAKDTQTEQTDGEEASKEGEAKTEGDAESKEGEATEGAATDEKGELEEGEVRFGRTHTFKPFHLNLGNPLEDRFLRLEISVEYKNGDVQQQELEARAPQLRDAVLSVASRKTREFLLGPDGKDQLRLEILNRLNQYMDHKIESVYITDILIEE